AARRGAFPLSGVAFGVGGGAHHGVGADRDGAVVPRHDRAHVARDRARPAGRDHGCSADLRRLVPRGGSADGHLGIPAVRQPGTLLSRRRDRDAGGRIGLPSRRRGAHPPAEERRVNLPESSAGFAGATWNDCLPYYEALASAPLDAASVGEWLRQWSRLEELLGEAASLAMIAYTCDTSDPVKEAAHLRFS